MSDIFRLLCTTSVDFQIQIHVFIVHYLPHPLSAEIIYVTPKPAKAPHQACYSTTAQFQTTAFRAKSSQALRIRITQHPNYLVSEFGALSSATPSSANLLVSQVNGCSWPSLATGFAVPRDSASQKRRWWTTRMNHGARPRGLSGIGR